MPGSIVSRARDAWNVFFNKDPTSYYYHGAGNSSRPDRTRLNLGNERSIVSSVYTRIALDVAQTTIRHVKLDDNGRFESLYSSKLDDCLNFEANIDQTGKAFIYDLVMSMFDEGVVAAVVTDADIDPKISGSYSIRAMRTGRIVQWKPQHVRVRLYNEQNGEKEEVELPKRIVGIIENPFYSVMNEPNSTHRRLVSKLNLLDAIDEQSGSGKMDLIIQVPYVTKSESQKKRAEDRRASIEAQLSGSKYGIAYTDGTEKVVQLNRPVENNLMAQIEYLTSMLYSQLGLTPAVFDGTATDEVLTNYYSRTIEPIVAAIVDEFTRKFLTGTARSQHQALFYFRDPFRFVPVSKLPEIVDKFGRNEILSPNEIRQIIGMKASDDPKANELRNRNLSPAKDGQNPTGDQQTSGGDQNGGGS